MDKNKRANIYAFLSRIFLSELDEVFINELKKDMTFLDILMGDDKDYIISNSLPKILNEMNTDFSTLFLIHNPPVESTVLEENDEVLVGLQNPVMQFYVNSGYELNLNKTKIQTPDHISIEFEFMANLVKRDEKKLQIKFLQKHLLEWVIPYLFAIKEMSDTVFYKNICDFTCEFLASEYENLMNV